MLRKIINKAQGREKIKDKELDNIGEAIRLLSKYDQEVKGSLEVNDDLLHANEKNFPVPDMNEFLKKLNINFSKKDYPLKPFHQVYSGENDERHYLDVYEKSLSLGDKKAELDFVVENPAAYQTTVEVEINDSKNEMTV